MVSGRIAVLADIHGNRGALEAVLRDAAARDVKAFMNLGDILDGPLDPRGTFQVLAHTPFVATVQGNGERAITEAEAGAEAMAWIRSLPKTALVGELFLCHGTPASDTTYLLEDVATGVPQVRGDAEILHSLGGVCARVILCGHSHIPRLVRLSSGQLVVNPGSVGLPAYTDRGAVPHCMETFAPQASYAIVEMRNGGWDAAFVRVNYDFEAESALARAHGREDWAHALLTGRALANSSSRG